MKKAEFIETTRQLITAGCFSGRHDELGPSMKAFCNALEAGTNITQKLSTLCSNRVQHEESESDNMTPEQAWDFLYKGIGNMPYKGTHRRWVIEEFEKNPKKYSEKAKALWLTVFSDQEGPILPSQFADLDSILGNKEIKKFAPLLSQALRDKNHPFQKLHGANFFSNLLPVHLQKGLPDKLAGQMKTSLGSAISFFQKIRDLTLIALFSEVSEISFEQVKGTYCTVKASEKLEQWLSSFPIKESVCMIGHEIYRLDADNLVIAKGEKTPGIRFTKNKDGSYTVCNNIPADNLAAAEAKVDIDNYEALRDDKRKAHLEGYLFSIIPMMTQSKVEPAKPCVLQ
jgi:hypothetical protein